MMGPTGLRLVLLGLLVWGLMMAPAAAEAPPPGPLSLKEAMGLAWKNNPSLQVSRLETLIAGDDVTRARSGFLPSVKAQVSQTIYDDPVKLRLGTQVPGPNPFTGLSFPLTNRNFWGSQVTAEQTIFDFWGTQSRYQAAIHGLAATRLDTAKVGEDVFLLVSQGFFRVLRAEKLVTVAQQEVTQLEDHLTIARNLYDVGVATYNDVLQAEVALADARPRKIIADNDVINLRGAFNKLLGLPVSAPTPLKDETDLAAPAQGLTQATQEALNQRPDLKAADKRIKQGENAVTTARSGYYPRIYAQAGHSWTQNDLYVHGSQYFAIFGFQWSLFNGFDTRAQVSQAHERLAQLKVRHQDLSEQVRLDVQNAYLGLKETADRIKVTKAAVGQGEENRRLNEERYKEQVGTATDVIDAQTLLTRARVNYFNALYDHQMAKSQMLWAVGAINQLLGQGDQGNGKK